MSASDLAPFVAAVFEDSAVAGLLQENNELKSKLTERLLVQVTGKNGTPVHYEESFKNAGRCNNDDDVDEDIYLRFNNGSSDDLTTDGLPLSSLNEIEIRVGGIVVQRFNIDDLIMSWYEDLYDEENQMECITLEHNINRRHLYGPIACVGGKIGPLPLGWREEHAVGDLMLLIDFLERVADESNDLIPQTLIIKGLTFYEKDITGMMSFIKE